MTIDLGFDYYNLDYPALTIRVLKLTRKGQVKFKVVSEDPKNTALPKGFKGIVDVRTFDALYEHIGYEG